MSGCDDAPPAALLEGIALFNRGEFYECHEVLEDLWRAEPAPVRSLYQGIIQIAVALHHLRHGNWRGAVKLLEAGGGRVAGFQPACRGVDTGALAAAAAASLGRLRELGAGKVDEFDWSLAPEIALVAEHG